MEYEITYIPTDEISARKFLTWKYERPYEVYNYASENFDKDLAHTLDPKNNIHSMYRDDELIGYCIFGLDAQVPGGDYSEEAIDIGMMIKPELTGQGNGSKYAGAVIQNGVSKYRPKKLRVTILESNLRAIKVWEKNGFQRILSFKSEKGQLDFSIFAKDV
jgi:RimJ/RimL family protein N-acetyltransferase